MTLDINEKETGSALVIKLEGELDSSSVSEFASKLQEITLKKTSGKYVVDMSRLEFISSAGWTLFVKECKSLRLQGGDMCFAAMLQNAERIYSLVGIDTFIKSYPTVDMAVKSFEGKG